MRPREKVKFVIKACIARTNIKTVDNDSKVTKKIESSAEPKKGLHKKLGQWTTLKTCKKTVCLPKKNTRQHAEMNCTDSDPEPIVGPP